MQQYFSGKDELEAMRAERDARRALEAAAPDLLAALKGLVSEQHSHARGCGCPWCAARAAIARAEGR